MLLRAVEDAPTASGTDAPLEAPFAVIVPVDGTGPFLTVELEGCHRVNVDMDNQLRTLHPTVVARLLG